MSPTGDGVFAAVHPTALLRFRSDQLPFPKYNLAPLSSRKSTVCIGNPLFRSLRFDLRLRQRTRKHTTRLRWRRLCYSAAMALDAFSASVRPFAPSFTIPYPPFGFSCEGRKRPKRYKPGLRGTLQSGAGKVRSFDRGWLNHEH